MATVTPKHPSNPAFDVAGQHAADRILGNQKLQRGSIYLSGEEPPTANQISAVLHALADHTLITHLLGPTVAQLGESNAHLGGSFAKATGVGRWLQGVGDYMSATPGMRRPTQDEIEKQLRWVMTDRCPICLRTYPFEDEASTDETDDYLCATPRGETCTREPRPGVTADGLRAIAVTQLIERGVPIE